MRVEEFEKTLKDSYNQLRRERENVNTDSRQSIDDHNANVMSLESMWYSYKTDNVHNGINHQDIINLKIKL